MSETPSEAIKTPENTTDKPPERVSSKKVIRRTGSGFTPSITDALNGRFSQGEKQEDSKEVLKYYTEVEQEEPFTKEQFDAKWKELVARYEDRPNLFSALSHVPSVGSDYKLLLLIGSATIDEEIKMIKPDLVSQLRRDLKNSKIELITKVDVQNLKKVIYSDSEKLQAMINKNPELNLFRQKFNLDFNE